ncbi:hypothetical protein EDD11_004760 [Mortierella claussenii]|nr:hypothetical protein EDD11_004760 [Mortierella claussenii]
MKQENECVVRHKPRSTLRRNRSEGCSIISHRPTLSLNSSKKALLSLQDRRIKKPDAKVHRLPDIQTTTGATVGTGLLVYNPEPSGTMDMGLWTSSSHILELHGVVSDRRDDRDVEEGTHLDMTDYQLQVSDKERIAIDSLLTEVTISDTLIQCDGAATLVTEGEHDRDKSGGLTTDRQYLDSEPATLNVTTSALESALSSALEKFTIDPNPIIDAGEIMRCVKRAHVLRELETTEETYVNDLDILLHVYLRVLETRSWFPSNLLAKMRRCCSGLLSLHRDLYERLDANKASDHDRQRPAPLKVYSNLAESFRLLHNDTNLYSTFAELRMRTVKEINRSAGQTTMTVLQKESRNLMAQQRRISSRADLNDFLIKPIQRICRYPLLLKEILRLTSEDDPEYPYIDQAYQLMKDKARDMDETQRTVERRLLTEQVLKKLPESSFPRKVGTMPSNKEQQSVGGGITDAGTTSNNGNNSNHDTARASHSHLQHNCGAAGSHCGGRAGARNSTGFPPDNYLDFGSILEGVAPVALTKAFTGTLGSIVLAGALEYVITPDIPIRLKYYGCFLFESMLIVVKAKKSSLYEPRQWLPLRLCELHETTRLDGYTRFGWRIIFDQFRIDFGASNAAEQHVWITTLRDRIQASKDVYSKLPRDIMAFETIVSSLPWKPNKNQSNMGYTSAKNLICQQTASTSPSPWSSCSSAIPSPLMPPPPSVSVTSTMMMAMSSMVAAEPEKWNTSTSVSALESMVSIQDDYDLQSNAVDPHEYHTALKRPSLTRHSSADDGHQGTTRSGDMAGSWIQSRSQESLQDLSEQNQGLTFLQPSSYSSSCSSQPGQEQLKMEAVSHTLYTATPVPWLQPETRQRTHSFDVARVFASSHSSGIKPNQRILVQSMFKDVSADNIWTTSKASRLSLQPAPSPSRYGGSSPLGYLQSIGMPPPPPSPKGTAHTASQLSSFSVASGPITPTLDSFGYEFSDIGNEGEMEATTAMPQMESPSLSLTSRLMRRRGSGAGGQSMTIGCDRFQELGEWGRRRNSATAAIAGTLSLNYRRNTDPLLYQQLGRRPSTLDNLAANEGKTSVKTRAQMIEQKASSFKDASKSHSRDKALLDLNRRRSTTMTVLNNDANDMDIMETLSNAAEAARSRRGNSERSTRAATSSTWTGAASCGDDVLKPLLSSTAIPTTCIYRSANSSVCSLATPLSTSASSTSSISTAFVLDMPKDGMERLWTAMGRMITKRTSHQGSEKFGRSRTQSNSSTASSHFEDHSALFASSPTSSPRRQHVPANMHAKCDIGGSEYHDGDYSQLEQQQATRQLFQHHGLVQDRPAPSLGTSIESNTTTLLQRSSTNGSQCTTASVPPTVYASSSPPSLAPFDWELTATTALDWMDIPSTPTMRNLNLIMTPSLSVTNCASETSPERTSLLETNHDTSSSRSKEVLCENQCCQLPPSQSTSTTFQHQPFAPDRRWTSTATAAPSPLALGSPSASRQNRRKSTSILQSITHSASQKFRTMIWSPSGLRRKNAMNHSPIMNERSSLSYPSSISNEGGQHEQEDDEAAEKEQGHEKNRMEQYSDS